MGIGDEKRRGKLVWFGKDSGHLILRLAIVRQEFDSLYATFSSRYVSLGVWAKKSGEGKGRLDEPHDLCMAGVVR